MITPHPTAQYGHVERVSVVRAIFSSRTSAWAAVRSKPSTDAVTPPTVPIFRKSLREAFIPTISSHGSGQVHSRLCWREHQRNGPGERHTFTLFHPHCQGKRYGPLFFYAQNWPTWRGLTRVSL